MTEEDGIILDTRVPNFGVPDNWRELEREFKYRRLRHFYATDEDAWKVADYCVSQMKEPNG